MRDVSVAAVHLRAEPGASEDNLERIEAWAARLADRGVEVVCFPEMSICGYDCSSSISGFSQPIPGPATDHLCAIAARQRVTLIAGLAESGADGRFHISQVIATPRGLAGVYRKAHLSPLEKTVFYPGDSPGVFPVAGCTWGVQICYDSHFPEWSTLQALAGAEVLFVGLATPHDEPDSLCERLLRYLPARAYDNSCYLVACNATGTDRKGRPFPGVALVVNPKGVVLQVSRAWGEGFVICTLNGDEIERIRQTRMGHFLAHRQPELYGGLCASRSSGYRGES
jgi:N-carbamoylputrescine amidase